MAKIIVQLEMDIDEESIKKCQEVAEKFMNDLELYDFDVMFYPKLRRINYYILPNSK